MQDKFCKKAGEMGEIRGYNEEKQKGEDAQSGCGGRRMCKMGGIYDDEKFFEQYAGMDKMCIRDRA